MIKSSNGQPLSQGDRRKPKGNYTGERLKVLRPETYRRVVRLLAEPRDYVSYREICRRCHVTDDTVKAVEQREAVPIAARKQSLMEQAARIARLAADRVEDQIDSATLPQAVVAFGVMTDKVLALSGDPAIIVQHEHLHAHKHEHKFQAITPETWDAILAQVPDESQSALATPIDSSLHQSQQNSQQTALITDKPASAPGMSVASAGMHLPPGAGSDKKD